MKKYFYLFLVFSTFSCTIEGNEIVVDSTYKNIHKHGVGKFSVRNASNDAFGQPLVGIVGPDQTKFSLGNGLFNRSFVIGRGPLFNAKSCSGCHTRDGRGRSLQGNTSGENGSLGFLMRISSGNDPLTGPKGFSVFGDQIQDRAVSPALPEALIKVDYYLVPGVYPDGSSYVLRDPIYTIDWKSAPSTSHSLFTSPRVGTQTIGMGFIDALTKEELLKNADENDVDGDSIRGRANMVYNKAEGVNTIGKFGWKANAPTLAQQIAGAFSGDMGMTTPLFPKQNNPAGQPDVVNYFRINGGLNTLDISEDRFQKVLMYQAALSVPQRRNYNDKNVLEGEDLFSDLACIKCHAIGLKVGESDLLPMINGTVINPYSDFLLHDMGDALADGRADFLATGNDWRTMPLWGIGLIKTINGVKDANGVKGIELLHDGRARGIEEAILWHGGEAKQSKEKFMNLIKEDRQKVLDFVNSL